MAQDNEFEKPTRSDLGAGIRKPWAYKVDYAAGKTPETFVDIDVRDKLLEKGKLGFYYWNKDLNQDVELNSWTFYHVETFIKISGADPDGGDNWIRYWSNYVRDTRTEPLTVWSSAKKQPIAKGLYNDVKAILPKSAKYTLTFIVWEPTQDMLLEMPLSMLLKQGIQYAIGEQLDMQADRVKLFDLAKNAYWGFRHEGYVEVSQDGLPYNNKGEMFFMPKFRSGVTRSLVDDISERRAQVQEWYEAQIPKQMEDHQAAPPPSAADEPPPPSNRRNDDLPF